MPSDKPKNHHFVPQSYLARFAENDNVWVFDKQNEATFHTSIRNVAAVRDFNRIPDNAIAQDGDEYELERAFSELESLHKQALDKFIETIESGREIGRKLRFSVAHALAFQYLRTAQMRRRLAEALTSSIDQIASIAASQIASRESSQVVLRLNNSEISNYTDAAHLILATNLQLVDTFARILADNHVWTIFQNLTSHPFITSDSPVTLDSTENLPPLFGVTFGSPGARMLFPVSLKYVIWTSLFHSTFEPSVYQVGDELKVKQLRG